MVEEIRSQRSSSSGTSLVHENAPQRQGQEILIQEEGRLYNETIELESEVQDQDSNSMAETESRLQEEAKSNQLTINNKAEVVEKNDEQLTELNGTTVEVDVHDSRQLNNETLKQDNSTDSLFTRLVRGLIFSTSSVSPDSIPNGNNTNHLIFKQKQGKIEPSLKPLALPVTRLLNPLSVSQTNL